jgi:hypothetical protein
MLNDEKIGDTQIANATLSSPDAASDDFTDEALRALAELDANGKDHIGLMLRFGEAASKAKAHLKHGDFMRWCRETLQRRPSWISSHRRLFEARDDLELALEWAATTGHRWAHCNSVERLLAVVADWRKAQAGDSGSAPRARRRAADIIADLRQQLADAESDFIALRDPLPQEVEGRLPELAAAARAHNLAATDELKRIARQFHWRYRALLDHESCGAPQVSDSKLQESGDGPLRLDSPPMAGTEGIGTLSRDEQRPNSECRGNEVNPASSESSPLAARLRALATNSAHSKSRAAPQNAASSRKAIPGGRDGF